MITPEDPVETHIVESAVFAEALQHQSRGPGHPEKDLKEHIEQILAFIDKQPWKTYRRDLRFLALTHDLGKYRVEYRPSGNIIGRPHAQISEEIARAFTRDERLLTLIRLHDKYFGFYKDATERARFKEEKFRRTFEGVDLDTLIRFNYADSNNRSKAPVQWFEDRCVELKMRAEKIYALTPGVLVLTGDGA